MLERLDLTRMHERQLGRATLEVVGPGFVARPRRRFMRLPEWVEYSGLQRPAVLLAIEAGAIAAKRHERTVLIDVASGDAFLDRLPTARRRSISPAT